MAKAGNYTAYQQLRPINVDWGEVAETGIKREDELYNRRKAEEKARKDARDKLGYDALEPVITGIDSLDKGLTLGIQEAATMRHTDYKQALNDPTFADSPEYKIRTKNLNNYSKNVASFSEGFKKLATDVISKSNDGSLSQWDNDLLNTLNGGFTSEKVKFGVKRDGSVKATIAMTDPNEVTDENPDGYVYDEDGKIKMVEVTPPEVFKGLGMFSVTEDVDIAKKAMETGTKLGKDEKAKVSGFETKTWQSWEEKKETVRKAIRGELGTPKRPTALAKRLWADDMGRESRELTEANMTEIEDEYLNKIGVYYDQMNKEDVDMGARERRNARAEEKAEGDVSPEIVVDQKTGELVVSTVKTDKGEKEVYGVSFGEGNAIKVLDTEAEKVSYSNIYVDGEGRMYADKIIETRTTGATTFGEGGISIDGKGWDKKEEEGVRLSEAEITNLAKNKNMKKENGDNFVDGKDFYDYINEKKANKPRSDGRGSSAPGDNIFN